MTALGVFASAADALALLTGDDEEFAKKDKPLPVRGNWRSSKRSATRSGTRSGVEADASASGLGSESARLRDDYIDDDEPSRSSAFTTRSLARAVAQVHDRNGRLGLVDPSLFHAPELFGSGPRQPWTLLAEAAADLGEKGAKKNDAGAPAGAGERRGPALVPFDARVRWFAAGIARPCEELRRRGGAVEFLGVAPEHRVAVTRGRVFDDAMHQLGPAVFASDAAGVSGRESRCPPPGL